MAMDVARSVDQVKARLAQFSGPQKTIVALLAVVVLIAGGSFYKWVTAPSYEVLLSGMEAADAAAVTAQLDGAGVAYKLEAGGTTVLVPQAQVQAQRLAVAAAGLPQGKTSGYETLDKQGLTSSSFQQKVAYQRAIEGELSKTLEQMADVKTATVHLSVPEKELYTDKSTPTRASVLLDTRSTLSRPAIDSVQHLVAAGVPNLDPAGVTVSDTKGTLLSSDGGGGGAEAEQALEDAAVARADSMLASVLGPGQAVVRVNAELDTTARTSEKESYDPTKSVPLRTESSKETYDSKGNPTTGGVVSVPDPVASAGTSGGNGTSVYGKDDSKQEFGVTRQVDKSTIAAGALKRLTVAVVLNTNAKLPPNQVVSDLISNAVGIDPARGDTISVANAAFNDAATAATKEVPPGRDYMRLGTIALAVLLLLVIALAFWKASRRGTIAEIPLAELELEPEPLALTSAPPSRALEANRREEAEQDMRVLEMVDSRPDEVSALIRSWLAEPVEAANK